MNLQWILNPAAQYGALALALVSCLSFFVILKREVHSVKVEARDAGESARSRLGDLARELQGLKDGIREIEVTSAPLPPGNAINLTKRTQALRMHRRGETIPTIAAALKTPQNEIRLLLKVHQMLS